MQKKIIALAVAGLSTAAFAQTNVTIYGVADVSGQGTNMSSSTARAESTGKVPAGGAFNLKSNSSLLGFKGTEDLGNGLKGLFQIETNVNMTGSSSGPTFNGGNAFTSMRDSYVGLQSKFGTVLGGYLSTPFRSTIASFDVMPGAAGDGRIDNLMGKIRMSGQALGFGTSSTGFVQADSTIRATALAYALPTMYGFNGSIAYTGSANNGGSNQTTVAMTSSAVATTATSVTASSLTSQTTAPAQGALSMNLGWTGYGVNIAGAFQQAKVNDTLSVATGVKDTYAGITGTVPVTVSGNSSLQGYTSYLVGASYTGVPGLKVAAVYNRNTVGLNGGAAIPGGGSAKGSNNAFWVGASYRFGNNEPRLSYANVSNTSGLSNNGYNAQDGATQWTANWGYYLSKRTQVYGLVSGIKNNANANYNFAAGSSNLQPTGGQGLITYGAGLRTNF